MSGSCSSGWCSRSCKPINIVILVITIIESLRAFDLVYILNRGINGLELLSVLVTNTMLGESSRVGFGSAIAVVLLLICVGPDHHLPQSGDARGERMTTARPRRGRSRSTRSAAPSRRPFDRRRAVLHAFLITISVIWLFPLAVGHLHIPPAVRRHDADTGTSRCRPSLSFDNYVNAWNQAELARYFLNTLDHRRPGGDHRCCSWRR